MLTLGPESGKWCGGLGAHIPFLLSVLDTHSPLPQCLPSSQQHVESSARNPTASLQHPPPSSYSSLLERCKAAIPSPIRSLWREPNRFFTFSTDKPRPSSLRLAPLGLLLSGFIHLTRHAHLLPLLPLSLWVYGFILISLPDRNFWRVSIQSGILTWQSLKLIFQPDDSQYWSIIYDDPRSHLFYIPQLIWSLRQSEEVLLLLNEETEAHRGCVTRLRSANWQVVKLGFKPRMLAPHPVRSISSKRC